MLHAASDVKLHLGLNAEFDAILGSIVAGIDQAAKSYTRKSLEQTAVANEKHCGDLRVYLDLFQYPVISVTTLLIAGVAVLAGSSAWEVHDARAGRLFRPSGWDLPSNQGQNNIDVTYVSGFAATSGEVAELKMALVEWSAARFRLRQKVEFQAESFQDHSATYWADMPGNTKLVLDRYRRVMS